MQRKEAREFVLSALYQSEFLPRPLSEMLEDAVPGDQLAYIEALFHGIQERRDEIDAMIGERTVGWRFDRLAAIDRNILRLGVFEVLFLDDVPAEVALNEAVELAKKFGTENARAFVNGILDRIWKESSEGNAA